jgi:two-component system, chemotaxis family, response regulator Rcp1
MTGNRFIDILLVEHNPGDVRLINDALKEVDEKLEMQIVWNGIEAIKFLRHESPFEEAPRPRVIVMDLNLPVKHGQVVLKEIKSDPSLALTPIIIFSGSDAPKGVSDCYASGANCYVIKPRNLNEYTETIRSLVDFWLRKVTLPSNDARNSRELVEG